MQTNKQPKKQKGTRMTFINQKTKKRVTGIIYIDPYGRELTNEYLNDLFKGLQKRYEANNTLDYCSPR